MPASSLGAMNSWGVYLVAAAALLVVISPTLATATRDSREAVDLRNVEGVSAILGAVVPGVHVRFSFGWPRTGDPISLAGHTLTSSFGSGVVSETLPLSLPTIVLYPGEPYLAYSVGGILEVSADG